MIRRFTNEKKKSNRKGKLFVELLSRNGDSMFHQPKLILAFILSMSNLPFIRRSLFSRRPLSLSFSTLNLPFTCWSLFLSRWPLSLSSSFYPRESRKEYIYRVIESYSIIRVNMSLWKCVITSIFIFSRASLNLDHSSRRGSIPPIRLH